jgi:holin-like protein
LLLTIAGLVFREEKAQVDNYRRERAAQRLIRHMGLLFVPAGAGVIAETGILRLEWLPIAAGLIRSTLLSLAVIGLV